jgi:phage gp29-like protein
MSQPSEIAVVVVWLNPNQNLSLYHQILDGFRVERTLRRPSMEYYFLKSEAEALKLKSHLERNLPSHDYRALAWIIHQVSSQKRKDALKGMMNTGFPDPAFPFGASIA